MEDKQPSNDERLDPEQGAAKAALLAECDAELKPPPALRL